MFNSCEEELLVDRRVKGRHHQMSTFEKPFKNVRGIIPLLQSLNHW